MGYESDLTDRQWSLIEDFFSAKKGRHFCKHSKRTLVNAVLYRMKTGCQWRFLPHDFPSWKTVFSFYNRASEDGIWEKAMDAMVRKTRIDAKRKPEPSYALIDSQSAKTASNNEEIGIDGGKKRKAESGIS